MKPGIHLRAPLFLICLCLLTAISCNKGGIVVTSGDLVMEFNDKMFVKISSTAPGAKPLMDGFSASEYLLGKKFDAMEYKLSATGGLYDIGYDIPEAHVISKGDTLFYAFYAKEWNGSIEFRGQKNGKYMVRDYVNNVDLGSVSSENPVLNTSFDRNLLVEAYPAK